MVAATVGSEKLYTGISANFVRHRLYVRSAMPDLNKAKCESLPFRVVPIALVFRLHYSRQGGVENP